MKEQLEAGLTETGGLGDGERRGYFGDFGGRFVPEPLIAALDELEEAFESAQSDPSFATALERLLADFAGRPTPLYHAEQMSRKLGGARIYLKREDLCHTGSHKINNTLGQCLLAQFMGKGRVIAETGAGQHGVACATTATLLGQECVVYMGEVDIKRQAPNVSRMQLLGAEVRTVSTGSRTLKDAVNEALREWVGSVRTTHYCLGSVVGPHPFPLMVRTFQSVIGCETVDQCMTCEGRLPDAVVACVGGGSNSIGMFAPFVGRGPRLVGGRRQQLDRHVRAVRRPGAQARGRRGRRQGARARPARWQPLPGRDRRPARREELPAAGRARAGARHALHISGARLSRSRARAFIPQRSGAG